MAEYRMTAGYMQAQSTVLRYNRQGQSDSNDKSRNRN